MPAPRFHIHPQGSAWLFAAEGRQIAFATKLAAIDAALRSARSHPSASLQIFKPDGTLETELALDSAPPIPGRSWLAKTGACSGREPDRQTTRQIQFYATQPVERLNERIQQLQAELPLEQVVYPISQLATLLALVLALAGRRRWAWVALGSGLLQAQAALTQRGPLFTAARRFGRRTRHELQAELLSLRALRGDFETFGPAADPMTKVRKCLELFL